MCLGVSCGGSPFALERGFPEHHPLVDSQGSAGGSSPQTSAIRVKSLQSCSTLSDPLDCGPPGSVCLLNRQAGSLALPPPGMPSSEPRCSLFSGVWVHARKTGPCNTTPSRVTSLVLRLCPRSRAQIFFRLLFISL